MCFQDDYCVVDGNLCTPGAIYCSDACRLADLNRSIDVTESILKLPYLEQPGDEPHYHGTCAHSPQQPFSPLIHTDAPFSNFHHSHSESASPPRDYNAMDVQLLYESQFFGSRKSTVSEPTILDLNYTFSADIFDPSVYQTESLQLSVMVDDLKFDVIDLDQNYRSNRQDTSYISNNYRTWLLSCTH
ncbi:hypothetical protein BABINDRAFT_159413 [Babjeviella inositovora NRRL Y-12698]|uniref:Uncharacterized protein n=1 Tax=Babjeviella inositovora NRRL Y-12698 TaxID=984486 RepID=A0A1E3QZ68_9ASCO|nr:uncharacterized protein BABINDRAFT_159413 [Babjeviella inositovora NRRL Y-12698]ODQ82928.1 hypothetical protein BABINDRAFT_159413 [Babjeviella inositovora NRRL Y-12698]